jgi:hypothetical protein
MENKQKPVATPSSTNSKTRRLNEPSQEKERTHQEAHARGNPTIDNNIVRGYN